MTTFAPSLSRWLSAADSSALLDPWDTPDDLSHASIEDAVCNTDVARTAVLTVTGMPRELRSRVEAAMSVCVPSESQLSIPGTNPLTADWFTSWCRDRSSEAEGHNASVLIGCRQVLTGEAAELELFNQVVSDLAQTHGFIAEVRIVD
ncbi:hypothetical protein [Corynebacterium alimapuense]|uniref:Uncharacterized protein n=1 Tax=Corynebacterium alimapuense TaxID=1576874 RepID=A0A3M8K8W4_9CORY|nr:hypothetical protein [Corynebacterium alimapuense]RNE49566.1 hypothetical protein C5L39_04240 [Corynebacterium alimapuense]